MDPQSLPDQPHGPYHHPPTEAFIGFAQRRTLLLAALGGVELGAWDARILDWLAHFCDTPTFLAVLGLLERARSAAAGAGTRPGRPGPGRGRPPDRRRASGRAGRMSAPSATQPPPVELRVLDPGGHALVFTWQVHGHGHLLATGQVAGAPNTPELAGWRYQAFTEAAQAAIGALKDLEAADRAPDAGDDAPTAAGRARACDFCAAAPAAWRYPTQGDRLATVRLGEVLVVVPGGDWYACPACHLLVEAGTWDSLSERARLPADQGEALWASFRAVRAGPALPLDREGRADA